MRPRLPAMLRDPGRLGHRFASSRYRQFFGLRSWLAVSSVASGRIEFVSRCFGHRCSTDYPFTSSCSPPRVATTQLLSVTRREAPPARDFHPLCMFTLKRTSRRRQSAHSGRSQYGADCRRRLRRHEMSRLIPHRPRRRVSSANPYGMGVSRPCHPSGTPWNRRLQSA